MELEMLDIDDIEDGSEYYSAAQEAKEKLSGTDMGAQRAVLAVVVSPTLL